eukprot:scaffold181939_cov14-Tisochrysis_lutea.AAC.1
MVTAALLWRAARFEKGRPSTGDWFANPTGGTAPETLERRLRKGSFKLLKQPSKSCAFQLLQTARPQGKFKGQGLSTWSPPRKGLSV